MKSPLVYQINTRTWLHEISRRAQGEVTLGFIPESEFREWTRIGFTHVWLMGVWRTGPLARAHSLVQFRREWHLDPALKSFSEEDVVASPFAIQEYEVAPDFGGNEELELFRKKLNSHGLKLLLDFVPNHVGLDHRWLHDRPELFVRTEGGSAGTFQSRNPETHIAHGRDPYFPPWTDTAQLDYRNPETWCEMKALVRSIASKCDGIRCDMAMLLLREVFHKTWHLHPCDQDGKRPIEGEFWQEAIASVKADHPNFIFIAEVYWDLERELQSLGFDFTYNKRIYDCVVRDEFALLKCLLEEYDLEYLKRGVHFLENHDEMRAARLDPPKHFSALLLMLALPGMRLIHYGQLTGLQVYQRIQLGRRVPEDSEIVVSAFYEQMLNALANSAVGDGSPQILRSMGSDHSMAGVLWQSPEATDVAVVNLSADSAQAEFHWPFEGKWRAESLLRKNTGHVPAIECNHGIFAITMNPFAGELLRFSRV